MQQNMNISYNFLYLYSVRAVITFHGLKLQLCGVEILCSVPDYFYDVTINTGYAYEEHLSWIQTRDPIITRPQHLPLCFTASVNIINITFTVLLYLCSILSIVRRLDYSAAIQELLSYLGVGTKQ